MTSEDFETPAPTPQPPVGAGLDGAEVILAPAPGDAPRPSRGNTLLASPASGHGLPAPLRTARDGQAPQGPVQPTASGGTVAGEQVAKPPSRTAPGADRISAPGAMAGTSPRPPIPGDVPAQQTPAGGDARTPLPSAGDQEQERTEEEAPESLEERQARQWRAIRQAKAGLARQQRNQRARPQTSGKVPGNDNGPGMIRGKPRNGKQ
jgi:hypothetical protein